MIEPEPDRTSNGAERPDRKPGWAEKRRAKLAAEIQRSRTGDHAIPTWVLAVAVVAMLAAWITLIVLA